MKRLFSRGQRLTFNLINVNRNKLVNTRKQKNKRPQHVWIGPDLYGCPEAERDLTGRIFDIPSRVHRAMSSTSSSVQHIHHCQTEPGHFRYHWESLETGYKRNKATVRALDSVRFHCEPL